MRSILGVLAISAIATVATHANAFPIDLDTGDSYPTEILITSPAGPTVSQFFFNSTYALTLSDSSFLIDANFNSNGSLNVINSVTITGSIDTGFTIGGSHVLASLEWQTTGNSANLDANAGAVSFVLSFKFNFVGTWKGVSETCRTGAFTVNMQSTGNSMPYTLLTGVNYTFANGYFQSVSNGLNIAAIAGTSCTAAHKSALQSNLSVGGTTNLSAMSIDFGFPTYNIDGLKVHGS